MSLPVWFAAACISTAAASGSDLHTRLLNNRVPLTFRPGSGGGFDASGPGYALTFSKGQFELKTSYGTAAVRFSGAGSASRLEPADPVGARANLFTGSAVNWRRGVRQYSRLRYIGVYPGIDVEFHGREGRLEYDFVVSPGADPGRIRLAFEGASASVAAGGDLVLDTPGGEIRHHKPVLFQTTEGRAQPVGGAWVLNSVGEASFRVAAYDRTRTLVIDPVVTYATYLGGSGMDISLDAAVHPDGGVVLAGGTASVNFPVSATAAQPKLGGAVLLDPNEGIGLGDAFVARFDAEGKLLWSTYLGGTAGEIATGVATDSAGNTYVTGFTFSRDFPSTAGVFQPSYAGGKAMDQDFPLELGDAFLTKLDPDGAILWSTFLGGSGNDAGLAIGVNSQGIVVVAGGTSSDDFPVSSGAIQSRFGGGGAVAPEMPLDFGDVFVAGVKPDGSALSFATYFGGGASDVAFALAFDGDGNIFLGGTTWSADFPASPGAYQPAARGRADAFLVKMNQDATSLSYAAVIGGTGNDEAYGVGVDGGGNAYLSGRTRGAGYPVTEGALQTKPGGSDDAFVTRLNAAGTELVYSTLLGGSGAETSFRMAVDADGYAWVAGDSRSLDFPTTPDAVSRTRRGVHDVMLARLDPAGSALAYSTLINASSDNKAFRVMLGPQGAVYVAGFTSSPDLPVTPGAPQQRIGGAYDAFLIRLSEAAATTPVAAASPAAERIPRGRKFLRWLKSALSPADARRPRP